MRKNKTMTDAQRLAYVQEYLSSSVSRYRFENEKGLTRNSISYWLRIFELEDKRIPIMSKSVNPTEEEMQEKIRSLEKKIKTLEVQLKQSNMARDAYDCMIDLAEETYNIKVRKNFDAK